MTRLVEFKDIFDSVVYVNPDRVGAVEWHGTTAEIHLAVGRAAAGREPGPAGLIVRLDCQSEDELRDIVDLLTGETP